MEGDRPTEPRSSYERQPEPTTPAEPTRETREEAKPSEWDLAQRKRQRSLIIRLVAGLALLILFVLFVTSNSESVRVDFVFVETRTPLVWVFLICALIGGLIAYLMGRSGRKANRKYIKELERRLDGRGPDR